MKNILITCLVMLVICGCNQSGHDSRIKPEPYQPTAEPEKPEGFKERDQALIGLWKGTEILGTGEFTMTNETFMEFMQDGSFLAWPGRSVGPDYSREEDKSKAGKGTWYTNGKSLHMIDPATNQDAETYYTVSDAGLLMSVGGSKKILFVRE
jgi:hypothetical protein